jgi:large subunit ribosomal protein L15
LRLNDLRDNDGARKPRRRVGRGIGSGKGKTGGRGQKGQKSREGVSIAGFEGGQMPLHMRLPKRGFNNIFAKDYAEVNLGTIQKAVDAGKIKAGARLDHTALKAIGLARGGKDGVRLLAKGELSTRLGFTVAGASKSAIEAVERAGGSIDIVVVIPAAQKAIAKKGRRRAERVAARKLAEEQKATAPYEPVSRGAYAPFRDVKPWLQRWRNATPDALSALHERLDRAAGTSRDAALLQSVCEAGELLRAAMSEPNMSSRTAITPREAEKAVAMQAIVHELQQLLLHPDSVIAQSAAVSLAMACGPDREALESLPIGTELSSLQYEKMAAALAGMLHDVGDHSYTTIFLVNKQEASTETVLRGGIHLSRALPFTLGGYRILLPGNNAPKISLDMIHILARGGLPPVEIIDLPPTPAHSEDEAILFSCTFLAHLPRPLTRQVRLNLTIGNIATQRYTITPEALAALPFA